MSFIELLLFGTFLAAANLSGGFLIYTPRLLPGSEKYSKYLIALGAGFMLAVICLEILPETLAVWSKMQTIGEPQHFQYLTSKTPEEVFSYPLLLFLSGYLVLYFFEQFIAPHSHLPDEGTPHEHLFLSNSAVYAAMSGLLFHTFFDGISLAAAALLDFRAGLLVFMAVFLHKVPEGFTVATLFAASGKTLRFSVLMSGVAGLTTLAGVLCVIWLQDWTNVFVAYALPFAAGVTFYVFGAELLPQLKNHSPRSLLTPLAIGSGIFLFFILNQVLENFFQK